MFGAQEMRTTEMTSLEERNWMEMSLCAGWLDVLDWMKIKGMIEANESGIHKMVRDYYLWALKECDHDVAIRDLEWLWEHLGRPSTNDEGILQHVVECYKLSMVQ
jgi:hypothetical protein